MDFQKFFDGDIYDAYRYMGAHPHICTESK